MELRTIERLLEKYFDAETTVTEERDLKLYFSSKDVAPHLEQYRAMFGYFAKEGEHTFERPLPLKKARKNYTAWMSVAASVVLLAGLFTFYNSESAAEQDLGTYDDPEVAFRETQKALNMLSKNVNVGMSSINYVGGQYDKTTKTIFKEVKNEKSIKK